jgi:hypothetical protein
MKGGCEIRRCEEGEEAARPEALLPPGEGRGVWCVDLDPSTVLCVQQLLLSLPSCALMSPWPSMCWELFGLGHQHLHPSSLAHTPGTHVGMSPAYRCVHAPQPAPLWAQEGLVPLLPGPPHDCLCKCGGVQLPVHD